YDLALRVNEQDLVGPSDEMLGTVRRGMHPSPAYLDRCGMPEVPDDLHARIFLHCAANCRPKWRFIL
ncbi:MAG: LysR family transcriptional regulator, partial [Oceanicola sp.]|nr:LysR family transcriptional regulator [Oceanicola sp.]